MTATIHKGPWQGGSSGGGPEDPKLEERVSGLERDMVDLKNKIDNIDSALKRLEPAIREITTRNGDINARIASVEGQLKAMPTVLQLFLAIITTWAAGAAIVFALLKATHP